MTLLCAQLLMGSILVLAAQSVILPDLETAILEKDYEKAYEKTVNYIKEMRKKFEKNPNA